MCFLQVPHPLVVWQKGQGHFRFIMWRWIIHLHYGVCRVLPWGDTGNHVANKKEVLPQAQPNCKGEQADWGAFCCSVNTPWSIKNLFCMLYSTSLLKRHRIITKKLITCYKWWYLLRHAVSKWEFGLVFILHLTLPLPSTDIGSGGVPTMTTQGKHMA